MKVSPINQNQYSKNTNFKAKIPYTSRIDAAVKYAEDLLAKKDSKTYMNDCFDILYHPTAKLKVHDFCENMQFLMDEYKPNRVLDLEFKFENLSRPLMGAFPWKFQWKANIKLKDGSNVTESIGTASYCDVKEDVEKVRQRVCFDMLNDFAHIRKSVSEPDLTYYSASELQEKMDRELVERTNLDRSLTVESLRDRLGKLKERLMQNKVEEHETVREKPNNKEELMASFWF